MRLPYYLAAFLWAACALLWLYQGFVWWAVVMVMIAAGCAMAAQRVDTWRYR